MAVSAGDIGNVPLVFSMAEDELSALCCRVMFGRSTIRRKAIITAVVSCLLLPRALSQTLKPVSYGEPTKLLALERMWNQAQVMRDATAVASMISDKFINTEYDGAVSDRGKFLADFADPKFQPSAMNIDDVNVEMYSTTAIVTGNYHTKGTYGGKPYEHFGRFTDTWVFQDSKWLCVASHSSLLKK